MNKHHTFSEISAILDIPLSTMYKFHRDGLGPKTVHLGRHFRVSESDLDAWLKTNSK
jgi:excisionase family DNA binding protein